ncbi:NAD(P)/FAD-dependent oxidoreductase [Mycobacterium antarcticum]|uniref:NAD(P)/FAD-dependent oxidoreductase n=1 Tax=Mycolicibacterium sp. TUM20984 TaxID=3023368 RepID=UPI00239943D3|nr:NAD(P)/FAD-dependent oxidoreductase [Mycolicibacterium sp. TUM20984]GLP81995.1 oxidoreductase [Mycolicibacterium sp. TUM20984]
MSATTFDDTEILVIGAGLAGLRCAGLLRAAGRDVRVWEASDDIGGRIRTDVIDGFRCDRGFQVLNPAYPELKHAVDVSALRLQPFAAGVAVRRDVGPAVWVHPLRAPTKVPAMLSSGGLGLRDVVAVGRWAAAAVAPAALKSPDRADGPLRTALDRAGVTGELRRVIDRFLSGVLLEDDGVTSNAFVLLLIRMFALGVPALPAEGMQALPRQLAVGLENAITLRRKVIEITREGSGWRVSDGEHGMNAQHVVVATDPVSAGRLAGVAVPPMHGVVTDWWAADEVPSGPPMLWVDGRPNPQGPVLNTAVMSSAAPSYAPAGRHLIAASALMAKDGGAPDEAVVRAHAASILGADATRWTLVTRHLVPHALPEQAPPLSVRRPVRTADGMWVCGDHRDTASIQGALVSGRRTAHEILRA